MNVNSQLIDVDCDELALIAGGAGCDDLSGIKWAACVAAKAVVDFVEGFVEYFAG